MNLYHLTTNGANGSRNHKRLAQVLLRTANEQDKRRKLDKTQTKQIEHSQSCSVTDATVAEVVKKNNSILANEIEPQLMQASANDISKQQTNLDELEDAIYLQCAKQIIKMKNSCILNNEKVIHFYSEQNLLENSTKRSQMLSNKR